MIEIVKVVLCVCFVFLVMGIFNSFLFFVVRFLKFFGVIELMLNLYEKLKFENVVNGNEN